MRIVLGWGLAAAMTTVALQAVAEPPPNKKLAGQRFAEGEVSFQKGDFEAARLAFLQAYALDADGRILWDLAICETKTHHALEALRDFHKYLSSSDATAQDRKDAQHFLDEASRETGHIVITTQPNALVTLDGAPVPNARSSEPIDVTPGPHTLEAHWGTKSKTAAVSPHAGETVTADLSFPEPPPASAAPSSEAPVAPPLAVKPAPVDQPPLVERKPSQAVRIGVAGGLAVGAIIAGVSGIFVRSTADSDQSHATSLLKSSSIPQSVCFQSNNAQCQQAQSAESSAASEKNISTGLFIGAAGLAGAAIASWFLLAPSSSSTPTSWCPQVSPTSAGLVLRRNF